MIGVSQEVSALTRIRGLTTCETLIVSDFNLKSQVRSTVAGFFPKT